MAHLLADKSESLTHKSCQNISPSPSLTLSLIQGWQDNAFEWLMTSKTRLEGKNKFVSLSFSFIYSLPILSLSLCVAVGLHMKASLLQLKNLSALLHDNCATLHACNHVSVNNISHSYQQAVYIFLYICFTLWRRIWEKWKKRWWMDSISRPFNIKKAKELWRKDDEYFNAQ